MMINDDIEKIEDDSIESIPFIAEETERKELVQKNNLFI